MAALGYWLDRQIESKLRANLQNQLKATLDSNVAAVTNWLLLEQHEVAEWAGHHQFLEHFTALLAAARDPDAPIGELRMLPPYAKVVDILTPLLDEGVRAVHVTDAQGKMLATTRSELRDAFHLTPLGTKLIAPVYLGQTVVLPPLLGSMVVENLIPGISDVPIIIVACPIYDDQKRVVGALFATIESDQEFTRLLDLATPAKGYDTYAFGPHGELLSACQYETQLHELGVIDSGERGASVLKVQVRDPGVNLMTGEKPKQPLSQRPLTKMAASAIAGGEGIDLDGYRDYRGVLSVGAWKWLKPYGFGIATEIDYGEAYAPLNYVRRVLWALVRADYALRRPWRSPRRFRCFACVAKLAPLANSDNTRSKHHWRGRHGQRLPSPPRAAAAPDRDQAARRRPSRPESHRPLRARSAAHRLAHPPQHGRDLRLRPHADDGIFYYAMEYLDGITSTDWSSATGPSARRRVINILRQVCGALAEAHGLGLVHRDIKPANIMLCASAAAWPTSSRCSTSAWRRIRRSTFTRYHANRNHQRHAPVYRPRMPRRSGSCVAAIRHLFPWLGGVLSAHRPRPVRRRKPAASVPTGDARRAAAGIRRRKMQHPRGTRRIGVPLRCAIPPTDLNP